MYKVLAMTEIVGQEELFAKLSDVIEITSVEPDRKKALEIIGEYDGFLSTLKFRTDKELLDKAVKLKAIFTPSTGLDHIDLDYAAKKGIAVYGMKNDRAFLDNVTATAELALALMLGVVRRIPWGFDAAKNGIWARDMFKGHQLSGKTMGILGYGRLGTIMAEYAKALRMHVIATDIKKIDNEEIEQVSFEELLERSDVISIHIHLNDSTRHLINKDAFDKMKKGAVLINTSRGGIVDEAALVEALESGKLLGAGVDVIDGEWMENKLEHPLIRYARTHENLLISPHVGGVCYESQLMAIDNTLKKVKDFFENGCVQDATDNLKISKVN